VSERLLARVASGLKGLEIGYMVIGGQAVLLYGEPRLTKDIDITLSIDADKVPTILELANDLKLRVLVRNPERFARQTKVLPVLDDAPGIRVDFIFSSSAYETEAIARAVPVRLGRATVKFASLEDLVIHKVIAARPRDLEDVKSVLTKNAKYDSKYIETWLRKFDKALDAAYLKSFRAIIRELR